MDWIERIFDISPDGGDGTTEVLVALVVVMGVVVAALVANLFGIRLRLRQRWLGFFRGRR
jgi:hypothetical protein